MGVETEVENVDAGQDLRGALEQAFKAQKEAPVAEVEKTAAVDTSSAETKQASDQRAAEQRARDEAGRFVKKDEKPDGAAQTAQTAQTTQTADKTGLDKATQGTQQAAQQGAQQAQRAPAPPNGWSAEAKAKWHELPLEVMQAVAAREQDLGKAAGKMDEERALGRELRQVAAPYQAMIAADGATLPQAFTNFLNTVYILKQGGPRARDAYLGVAKQFGIDLSAVTQATAGNTNSQGTAAKADPELLALRQEVAQLKGHFTSREAQAESAMQAQIQQDIEAFAADPKNAHYEEVKADMAALLRAGRAKDLPTAYDMACWARPDVRTSILAQQRAEDEQKRRETEKARTDEARRKSVSLTGAPGATVGANGADRSLRDEIAANFAAQRSAV